MAKWFGGVVGKISVYEADDRLSPKYKSGKPVFLPRRAFLVAKQAMVRKQVCVELDRREVSKLIRALDRWRKQ